MLSPFFAGVCGVGGQTQDEPGAAGGRGWPPNEGVGMASETCSRSRAVAAGRLFACPAAAACSSGFAQSLRHPHSCPFVLVCPAGFKVGSLMLRTGFGTGSIYADGLDAQDVQLQAAGWVAGSRVGRKGSALPWHVWKKCGVVSMSCSPAPQQPHAASNSTPLPRPVPAAGPGRSAWRAAWAA